MSAAHAFPPVVYAGPTIDAEAVRRWLPAAQPMPPVRRGDLYRDRMLGFSVFLIIDGVFFNELAIPPREILDVIKDGGAVIGASSMGALRAAECWPAGMLGVGTIYRLFRRGALDSDDEVAVVHGPQAQPGLVSIPLVNVRHAAARLRRRKLLSAELARRVVAAAAEIFYADRTWDAILGKSGIDDDRAAIRAALKEHDLKRTDAIRALKRVARLTAPDRAPLGRARVGDLPFVPNEWSRERNHDAFSGARPVRYWPALWNYLLASGRYRHYLPALARAPSAPTLTAGADVLAHGAPLARSVRAKLVGSGAIEALGFRYFALEQAARRAREKHWKAGSRHRVLAESEIARAHGYASFAALRAGLTDAREPWALVSAFCETLSLAKRLRDELFRPGGMTAGVPPFKVVSRP